jgi:adenylylsulfate reductase subunit A
MQITSEKIIHTDVLIIGGGTAGCYAALTLRSLSDASVVIAEKAAAAAVWQPASMP